MGMYLLKCQGSLLLCILLLCIIIEESRAINADGMVMFLSLFCITFCGCKF